MANTQNQNAMPTDIGSLLNTPSSESASTNNGSGSTPDSVTISQEAQLLQEASASTNTVSPMLVALVNSSSPGSGTAPTPATSIDQAMSQTLLGQSNQSSPLTAVGVPSENTVGNNSPRDFLSVVQLASELSPTLVATIEQDLQSVETTRQTPSNITGGQLQSPSQTVQN